MLDKALSKLNAEMEEKKDNPYVQVVGKFLVNYLDMNPEAAEKILAGDKTIAKSLDEMRKVAEKKKVGNCAVLTDQEGFEVVLKYFGIKDKVPGTEPVKSKPDFDVKLEDLL